jgi:NAD(P)-dependent dehydrogenase (short-subunit alcohol dehydrogenase family)
MKGASLALLYAPFEAHRLESALTAAYGPSDQRKGIQTYACDITSDTAIEKVFTEIEERQLAGSAGSGKLLPSILVNAAGYVSLHPFESTPTSEIVKHLNVNLLGPILLSQTFARMYFAHKNTNTYDMPPGRIVNIASQAAHVALALHGPYCASKSGLIGATRSMASEWGAHGITANTISPGPVMTDLGRKAWGEADVRDA